MNCSIYDSLLFWFKCFSYGYGHRLGNKTFLLREYRERVSIVKEQRLMANRLLKENILSQVSN